MIRPKISLFSVGRLGHSDGEKDKERREEEKKKKKEEGRREEEEEGRRKKKKIQVWNSCLELLFGTSLLFGFVG